MAIPGLPSPQEGAIKATQEGKEWDGVKNAQDDRKAAAFNAAAALNKKINY
jgi:hypothetical protein